MPRYVILRHEIPKSNRGSVHWDFMLERGALLRTWALAEEPSCGHDIAADQLADHRLDYLDYEGPISGDRGNVKRWDLGEYESVFESDNELCVVLRGRELAGNVALRR